MKELLKEIIYTFNQLPNRKVKGRDYTTYELVAKVEKKLREYEYEKEIFEDYINQIIRNS